MLTELQRVLIEGLQICGLKQDDILAVITLLEKEEQQWALADYLETVVENPPDRTEVFEVAVRVAKA